MTKMAPWVRRSALSMSGRSALPVQKKAQEVEGVTVSP